MTYMIFLESFLSMGLLCLVRHKEMSSFYIVPHKQACSHVMTLKRSKNQSHTCFINGFHSLDLRNRNVILFFCHRFMYNTHFIPLLRFYWMRHAGPALSMDFPQKHRSCSRPCSLSEHSDAAHQRSSYSKKHSLVKDPGSSRCLWRASPMLSGPSKG